MIKADVNHLYPPPPDEVTQSHTLFPLQNQHHPPINIVPSINGQEVSMELDTGATISVINEGTSLPLIVLRGSRPSLFSRNWLEKIKLNWPQLCTVSLSSVGP